MSTIPTVYFIDDSATMREVIKIAFRRENINVVACHDAATALVEIETAKPDIVITDVIMPDKDGYDVCQHIKSHPALAKTPVILMSGVVNRAVAEKSICGKGGRTAAQALSAAGFDHAREASAQEQWRSCSHTCCGSECGSCAQQYFFAAAAAPMPPRSVPATPAPTQQRAAVAAAPGRLSLQCHCQLRRQPRFLCPNRLPLQRLCCIDSGCSACGSTWERHDAGRSARGERKRLVSAAKAAPLNDAGKLKIEIMRLEGLVKKLQSELQAEREYSRALEAHVKTLQESD